MNKLILLATTALVALGTSLPAFADSATITQTGETNGFASQHQPGQFQGTATDDTATIVQAGGTGDSAIQEQDRGTATLPPGFFDLAANSTQMITQTNNVGAVANQEDNTNGPDVQTITQIGSVNSTSANQTVNTAGSSNEVQRSLQNQDNGSAVVQIIGASPNNVATENSNTQVATQSGQTASIIGQSVDGTSNNNSQTATENTNGVNNRISATILNGNSNTIVQTQDVNARNDVQSANIFGGNADYIEQYQGVGSASNSQDTSIVSSSAGRALQYQSTNVTGGSQTIDQNAGGADNQAGQGQGNSNNVALITQNGGAGNIAIQNQGLGSSDAGFMFVNGAGVVVHN
jgi:hypothetical protein